MKDLEHTAIHEAGHVVAHIRFGIDQLMVSILKEGATLGRNTASDSVWNSSDAKDQIISLCAGYAAVRGAGFTDEEARLGCCDDFSKAESLIEIWHMGDLEQWLTESIDFMSQPENVRAVRGLADLLLVHKELASGFFLAAVEYFDGECSEEEWKHYTEILLPSWGQTPSTAA